jgi:hypothetical protein
MRPIGFSTGSLAKADFAWAIDVLKNVPVTAIELSALRFEELEPLIHAITAGQLDLDRYEYISVHAPSRIPAGEERHVVDLLQEIKKRRWPIVVHPDVISDVALWKSLNGYLCVENMDIRKSGGRTKAELDQIFEDFPKSKLCFDIAHAKQIDGTMAEAASILLGHGSRIKQIHISEVNFDSVHYPMNRLAVQTYQKVYQLIPNDVPLILESPTVDEIEDITEWMLVQMDEAFRSVDPTHRGLSRKMAVNPHKKKVLK